MTDSPLLSITIPTWNRASFLHEQLSMLTGQVTNYSLTNKVEIVITDNGSDDNTYEIVSDFISRYSYITYFNNEINKGARFNLIKALELAKGKYCIFLGDDDRYKNDGLIKMISCLEENENVDAVFDTYLFKNNHFKNQSFVSLQEILLNFYYFIGNAGLFIIQTNLIHQNIKKYGYNYFSLSWPQTQLIILSLNKSSSEKILLTSLNLFSESIHDKLMMYNSYYLLRGLYFDLSDAINDIKSEIHIDYYNAARQYLKHHIIQNTFNILQCGVFVDNHEQRNKTISYLKKNKFKYTSYERRYLNLIILVLSLPTCISKTLSNFFILITRGKNGLTKKNNFVKNEIDKIMSQKNNNKSVRSFDFNPN